MNNNYKYGIIIFLLILIYVIYQNTNEKFTILSNESIQALSSVYNSDTVNVNNVTTQNSITTNTLTTTSDSNIGGNLMVKTNLTIGGNIKPLNVDTNANPNGITVDGRINVADRIKTNNMAITGALCIGTSDTTSLCMQSSDLISMVKFYKQKDRMYNNGAIIYQNILDILTQGIISKSGNPNSWDQTSWTSSKLWNGSTILNFGNKVANTATNGLQINISKLPSGGTFPKGFTQMDPIDDFSRVIWVRVLSDRWFSVNLLDSSGSIICGYTSGKRNLTSINPNGNQNDSGYNNSHQWVPMAISSPIQNTYYLTSQVNSDTWISGIAFSKNPWNHATNGALAYHWAVNGGTATTWNNDNWNNDVLSTLDANKVYTLNVPIVWSPYDKIVYFVEHNNNWNGGSHKKVTVNGVQVDNFSSSYMNPFATHFNSKIYNRYFATKIPNNLIKQGDKTISLVIDMTGCVDAIFFREIGTHDYL